MRKLFGIIWKLAVVLAIALVVTGFFRGWFNVSKTEDGEKTNINITIDREKIGEDKKKVKQKAGRLKERAKEKIGDLSGDQGDK